MSSTKPPNRGIPVAHCTSTLDLPSPIPQGRDCACVRVRLLRRTQLRHLIMNLLLSDDYLLQDYPENITNTIRSGHSTCLRFNRNGDFLASGRVDGTVVVWDLETMGVARKLRGHSKSITSLSWSRCGRYLLSACQGWKAILWDLQDGKRYREVRFRGPVYIAELHPVNPCVHPSHSSVLVVLLTL